MKTRRLNRLADLQDALVEGRIVAGMTQKELARRVGLPEQQIQRYEGTRYRGVSLERLDEIGSAIGLHVEEVVYKRVNRPASSSTRRRVGQSSRSSAARKTSATKKRAGEAGT